MINSNPNPIVVLYVDVDDQLGGNILDYVRYRMVPYGIFNLTRDRRKVLSIQGNCVQGPININSFRGKKL